MKILEVKAIEFHRIEIKSTFMDLNLPTGHTTLLRRWINVIDSWRWNNVNLMLGYCQRQRPSIKSTSEQPLVFTRQAGILIAVMVSMMMTKSYIFLVMTKARNITSPWIWKGVSDAKWQILPLCKVVDIPSHIQGDDDNIRQKVSQRLQTSAEIKDRNPDHP